MLGLRAQRQKRYRCQNRRKNYNTFKTRKNRTVYDGGGILPDLQLEESKLSTIANALIKNDGIFNYATDYYYKP
jgi:carboxyl-terminal processing protease